MVGHSSSLNASLSALTVGHGHCLKHSLQQPRSLSGVCIAVISLTAYKRLTLRFMSWSMTSCKPLICRSNVWSCEPSLRLARTLGAILAVAASDRQFGVYFRACRSVFFAWLEVVQFFIDLAVVAFVVVDGFACDLAGAYVSFLD
jgi:hypothetical protein